MKHNNLGWTKNDQQQEPQLPESRYYGSDCPVGMVQVEFVGCDPALMYSKYGWKPVESAFLEIWVDGRRFRIQVGDFHDGYAQRRGLHIVGSIGLEAQQTALNAASLFYGEGPQISLHKAQAQALYNRLTREWPELTRQALTALQETQKT